MDRNGSDGAQEIGRQTVDLGEPQKCHGENEYDEPQAEVRGHAVVAHVVLMGVEEAKPDGDGDCHQNDHGNLAWPSGGARSSVHGSSCWLEGAIGLPYVLVRPGSSLTS